MTDTAVQWPARQERVLSDPLFDPLSEAVLADPYPAYVRMRDHARVYWHDQLNSWVLTGHAECQEVLRDSDRFGTDFRRIGIATPPTLLSLQTLDPPDHTPLRHLGLATMRTLDLPAIEAALSGIATERLGGLLDRGSFDFVADFSDWFTMAAITAVLGVTPPTEDETFHRLNRELDASMDSGVDAELEGPGLRARQHFNALVESWLDDPPPGGAIEYLAEHQQEGGVEKAVLVNSIRAFFHAGFEVPSRFLGNAVAALIRQPAAMAALLHGAPIDPAVEELVRFGGPVHALSRACTQDTTLGGTPIERGQIVIAMIGAGDRDPLAFPDPDVLHLDRDPNPHLGFGRGSHSCLGSMVGRLEARVVLSVLTSRNALLRLDGEPVVRPSATLRGLRNLPVARA
ncbi:cytochrome P450 [Fodinicola feengrottensis]|uniref:Cytochrome P450 n=1 Tax=Fodinicola feengrottensis TaxID=435914 RepID=A0ABN2IYN1_9ACTN